MAGTVTAVQSDTILNKLFVESYVCTLGAADTTATITPTNIKAIMFASVVPMNAASCAAGIPYLTTFTPGDAEVTITGANNTQYLVKVYGLTA